MAMRAKLRKITQSYINRRLTITRAKHSLVMSHIISHFAALLAADSISRGRLTIRQMDGKSELNL
eukprot:scaffold472958_cov30-Prasinocladus_malaysianus.AAC.1